MPNSLCSNSDVFLNEIHFRFINAILLYAGLYILFGITFLLRIKKREEIIPSLFLLLQNEIEISHENSFPTRKLGMKNVLVRFVRFCSLLNLSLILQPFQSFSFTEICKFIIFYKVYYKLCICFRIFT